MTNTVYQICWGKERILKYFDLNLQVYLGRNKQSDVKYAVKIVAKKDKNGSCTKNIVDEEKKIFRIINC